MEAQRGLQSADLDGFAALYDQHWIIALRQAIDYRAAAATADEMLLLMDRGGTVLAGTRAGWPAGLAAMRRAMLGLLGALLVAGALVGGFAARSVMARINRINALADRVAEGQLDARLPRPRSDDEFGLLETHVQAMLDRIRNLNRATHRLSDIIAHELRTPLNRMLQKLGWIEDQDNLTAELKTEMRQAICMFDPLLDISRAEADQGTGGGLVPVDLSVVTTEMWELYQPLAEDKGLLAGATIDPGLGVLSDRNLIAQMLANLLDNAIKWCTAGDRHLMRVADTGPGLPGAMRGEAFARFVRAERDRALPGHGLGLALVRAIAARHGAQLSMPGGSGFTLEILWPRLQQSG